MSREGQKILGTALPTNEDRLREVSQRTQGKRQVPVVVDQPTSSAGPRADSGPVGHPAPARPSRLEASGQGKDWRQPLHSTAIDTATSSRLTHHKEAPHHEFITTIHAALRIPTSPSP